MQTKKSQDAKSRVPTKKARIIIVGRAPGYGVGKRRLARDVGNLEAWQFSRRNLTQTRRQLTDKRWQLLFAATPDKRKAKGIIKQGQGDLGARMLRQLRGSGIRPVVLIGSDVPMIKPRDIQTCLQGLKQPGQPSVMLGPSDDGGFWLIATRGKRLTPQALSGIAWSQPTTRDDTVNKLTSLGATVRFTTPMNDVDDGPSLEAYRSSKRGMSSTKLQGR